MTTRVYFPPVYKDWVNTNPDRNSISTQFRCMECNTNWSEQVNPNVSNFWEQIINTPYVPSL